MRGGDWLDSDYALVRYNIDGTLDTSFGGGDGIAIIDLATGGSGVCAMALTPDRKVVLLSREYITGDGQFLMLTRHFDWVPTVQVYSWDSNASEGRLNTGNFVFFRDQAVDFATRVFYTVSGTATAPWPCAPLPGGSCGIDYTGVPEEASQRYVDIPAGALYAAVTITPLSDSLREGNELATLSITPNAAYDIGAWTSATVTIADGPV
jgi:hypothetical protein